MKYSPRLHLPPSKFPLDPPPMPSLDIPIPDVTHAPEEPKPPIITLMPIIEKPNKTLDKFSGHNQGYVYDKPLILEGLHFWWNVDFGVESRREHMGGKAMRKINVLVVVLKTELDDVELLKIIMTNFLANEAPTLQFDDACLPPQLPKVTMDRNKRKWVPTRWGYIPYQRKVSDTSILLRNWWAQWPKYFNC